MDWSDILQRCLNGLSIGSVYAIFALGYTLVFSILGIINFAHGAVFALGAYFTYALSGLAFGFNGLLSNAALPFALPFVAAMLGGSVLAGLAGIAVERVAFRPLRRRGADRLLYLVSSLGVALVLVNLIQYLVGAEPYAYAANVFGLARPTIDFGGAGRAIPVRTIKMVIFGVAMALVVLLTLLINYSRVGKALQAVAEDATTASLLGINTDRLIMLAFFVSGFLGGMAGTLVAASDGIPGPTFGTPYAMRGLAVIVLGGLGNIPGAVVGGLILGLGEAFVPAHYNAYKDALAFALLFVILLARPQGILGGAQIQKV